MTNFYQLFNDLKKELWNAQKLEDLEPIKGKYLAILSNAKDTLSEQAFITFQNNVSVQMKDVYSKKKTWLSNKKTYPAKQSFILREDEGKAFTALCFALTEFISLKINKSKN